jgi:hypothetical protein
VDLFDFAPFFVLIYVGFAFVPGIAALVVL